MKKVTQLTTAVALASSLSVPAIADSLSTNIGVTSNYLWRGVSQTGSQAAVSGGIDYESQGFYLGTWISNTVATSADPADDGVPSSEQDIYIGYSFGLGGTAELTFGYIQYLYPTVDGIDFGEINVDFAIEGFSAGVAFTVTSDGDSDDGDAFADGDIYAYLGYEFDLGYDWSLGLTYGSYMFDADEAGNGLDYDYFQADLNKGLGDFGDITFALAVADEEDSIAGDEDPITTVSWSKGF